MKIQKRTMMHAIIHVIKLVLINCLFIIIILIITIIITIIIIIKYIIVKFIIGIGALLRFRHESDFLLWIQLFLQALESGSGNLRQIHSHTPELGTLLHLAIADAHVESGFSIQSLIATLHSPPSDF